jgi:hypothetical protein
VLRQQIWLSSRAHADHIVHAQHFVVRRNFFTFKTSSGFCSKRHPQRIARLQRHVASAKSLKPVAIEHFCLDHTVAIAELPYRIPEIVGFLDEELDVVGCVDSNTLGEQRLNLI